MSRHVATGLILIWTALMLGVATFGPTMRPEYFSALLWGPPALYVLIEFMRGPPTYDGTAAMKAFFNEEPSPMTERPWIPFNGHTTPDNVHLMAIHLKLKSGEIRFADVGAAIMWENFGSGSDIVAWRPAYSDVTADNIRQIPLPPSTGINAWIDSEISRAAQGTSLIGRTEAAEIARGAALAVIADKDTLIANLRRAGYFVSEPRR